MARKAKRARAKRGKDRDGERRSDVWALAMYKTESGDVPATAFLAACPKPVRLQLLAILVAVRDAPPPRFPPSNMWHVMTDELKGLHEARDRHGGDLYRLFSMVDRNAPGRGLDAPTVALLGGGVKRAQTKMDPKVYREAIKHRDDYLATRRILLPPGIPGKLTDKP